MIQKAKKLFYEHAFTSHEGTHHAVDFDDFMLIIEELAKDIPKSFDEHLKEVAAEDESNKGK